MVNSINGEIMGIDDIYISDEDQLIQMCKELLKGADMVSQEPYYIVQPFMGIVLRNLDLIEKYNLMDE